jgi:hypothetical protein
LIARGLNIRWVGGAGVHTFLLLIPNQPKDFGGKQIWTIGGFENNGRLITEINNEVDTHWSNWKSNLKGIYNVPTPEGKSDSQFIKDIMNSYSQYKSGSRQYFYDPDIHNNQGNCNNITSGAMIGAGVSPDFVKQIDPKGYNPGLGTPLQEMVGVK